ncbi:extracellular solute-binding protein [Blautia sp. RD014234]|nr:extracellular solute-binding protein [Blautia parvula]
MEQEALEAGINGFLTKPVFRSELVQKLRYYIMGSSAKVQEIMDSENRGRFEGLHVLMAEDNELNREIVEELLRDSDILVDSVEDGLQAVRKVEQTGPGYYDTIFMDIHMPVMDGFTATGEIRALQKNSAEHIPIIAMTADAFEEDVLKCKNAGMDAHISKPIDIARLLKSSGYMRIRKAGMEKMKRRYRRLTAAALACMLLCSGCSGEKEEPEVYIDKNEPDVAITLFTQGENISEIINKCCSDAINPKTKGNIILYSDFADFYAEEGLSYRELLLKRMESGQADDLYIIPAEDVLEFDQKGFIYDLSGLDCISSLSEDALRQSTYKGKVFSVPLSYTGFGLIWNVDMLHQYQLEIPETLDEFWNVCDVLKQNGILSLRGQ